MCIRQGGNSLVKLSEQNAASCDGRNRGCRGGWPSWNFEHLQRQGVCKAQDDPYTSANGRLASCNSACSKVPVPIQSVQRLQGEQQLIATVDRQPVVVLVAAGNNAWKQYSGGVLSSCDTTTPDHAVVAVGYDATSIKIRNSWGPRWGESGYIRLRRGGGGSGVCSVAQDITHIVMK
ncbi:hypothetical protein ATCC90586_011706 [Pythium insidiosum]|nr:hypothetical protein ATCC90586_011706 [Pythium insidiosum]